jgi:hypothetical protein
MRILWLTVLLTLAGAPAWAADWPQLACTPQRTGRSPENLAMPAERKMTLLWHKGFWPDRVHNAVQAIVVGGRLYIGSKDGTVWCLDAKNRTEKWAAKGLGCINNTLACVSGTVIVPSLDGVHGLDAQTGQKKWSVDGPGGFTTAPLVAEEKVFIGSRLGTMYCLNPTDGKAAWTADTGSYILQSAAYDQGRIFFATEDLRMRCLNARNGQEVWKAGPFRSQSFVHFHPVVHQGHVIFRGMATQPGLAEQDWAVYPFCSPYDAEGDKARAMIPGLMEALAKGQPLPAECDAAGEKIVELMKKEPWRQDLWILDAKTGTEAFMAPHFPCFGSLGLGDPLSPPAVDRDGRLVIHVQFTGNTFGRLDLKTRKVADVLFMPLDSQGKPPGSQGNGDEFRSISTAGDLVFMVHAGEHEGAVAMRSGVFDLRSRTWLRKDGPINFPDGSGSWFEHQGAAASVAEGRFYHVSYDQIQCIGSFPTSQ